MEYKIKELTFTADDLKTTALIDIKTGTICRSHVFHFLPGKQKAMCLIRAGEYVEASFINKYIKKGVEHFYQLDLVAAEDMLVYKKLWQELKSCKTGREQALIKDQIISQVIFDFDHKEKSFLAFVATCFEEFYIFPVFVMDKLQNASMVLYSRALLTSSLSVFTSLCSGYTDYKFIKDFFNVCFIMDYGLVEYENYNFTLNMACETERNTPGSGLDLLQKMNRSELEQKQFRNHPLASYEFALNHSEAFANPELIELIKFHHEKIDGSGFPVGHKYSALSDTETLLMFCDYLVPFAEQNFAKADGKLILIDSIKKLKEMDGVEQLPIHKIINTFESATQWAQEKVKKDEEDKLVVDEDAFGEAS